MKVITYTAAIAATALIAGGAYANDYVRVVDKRGLAGYSLGHYTDHTVLSVYCDGGNVNIGWRKPNAIVVSTCFERYPVMEKPELDNGFVANSRYVVRLKHADIYRHDAKRLYMSALVPQNETYLNGMVNKQAGGLPSYAVRYWHHKAHDEKPVVTRW